MSFYATPVKSLTFAHLQELVQDGHQENVRLEFKSQPVGRDDLLKKICGFANTSGGRIILGMAEGPNSVAREVCGVGVQPSFEAQITGWCAQNLYPQVIPAVSNPIVIPNKAEVAYVIAIEESELAPHFIEGRQGCYIRTNEGSHRFEARLADLAEIQALLIRREEARLRARELEARSMERLSRHLAIIADGRAATGPAPVLTVRSSPRFPRRPLVEVSDLARILRKSTVAYRRENLPSRWHELYSQTESIIAARHARVCVPFLEVTVFGTSTYGDSLEVEKPTEHMNTHMEDEAAQGKPWLAMQDLLGRILVATKMARNVTVNAGVHGALELSISVSGIKGVAFFSVLGDLQQPCGVALSFLDDAVRVERQVDSSDFAVNWSGLAHSMWHDLYYCLGWKDAYETENARYVESAKKAALGWLGAPEEFLA